jgi:hypothetical protein
VVESCTVYALIEAKRQKILTQGLVFSCCR